MPEISFLEGPNEPDPDNTGVGTGRALFIMRICLLGCYSTRLVNGIFKR